jgi:cytosine/adenosine deaminase-related metal-dependent hydrolase
VLATTSGLVCAHHHLYSSLARGMPAGGLAPIGFTGILESVWWRLDRALDAELISWSARLGALEALEAGTTAIVDHHSSPNAVEGSLDLIAAACAEVGVRVLCCYEVTDRNGADGTKQGLAENERFLRGGGRGHVGAHACFTLSEETLESVCGLATDLDAGVHIHVAEDVVDAGAGARLEARARPSWLLAHAVHLDRVLPGTVVHNPRSNLNNGVGYGRPRRWSRVALGTDGIGADMLEEARLAFALARADDLTATAATVWSWLGAGAAVVPDVADDAVEWTYSPMDPDHLAYTPGANVRAARVSVAGRLVLDESGPTLVDAREIRARAAEQARRLFSRMADVS